MPYDKLNDETWVWTVAQMNCLKDIAARARVEAKKQISLSEKIKLQRIAERAEKGLKAIALVFGDEK